MTVTLQDLETFENIFDAAHDLGESLAALQYGGRAYVDFDTIEYEHDNEMFTMESYSNYGGCGDEYNGQVRVYLRALEDPEAAVQKEKDKLEAKKSKIS